MSELSFREIPKCQGLPHYKDKVKCLWCNEKVDGKGYKRHCERKKGAVAESHPYWSYKVIGTGKLNFFKPKPSKPAPKPSIPNGQDQIPRMVPITPIAVASQESEQNMQRVDDNGSGNQIVDKDENDEMVSSDHYTVNCWQCGGENEDVAISNVRTGKKRMRQPDLFETLGKFQQLQIKSQEIVRDMEDPTHFDYLKKIQAAVAVMQKAEADVWAYREEKRRKLKKIKEIARRYESLGEQNRDLQAQIHQRNEQLVSQEMAQGARVVKKDELMMVEKKHRQNTENVLKSLPHFDVSQDGKHLICRICDEN